MVRGAMRSKMLWLSIPLMACGASAPPPAAPNVLRVAGQYPTVVTLESTTCSDIQTQSVPTAVTHTAGASSLVLVHGGLSWNGQVQTDGEFTAGLVVTVGQRTHSLPIAGQFSTTGFEATVTATVTEPGQPSCGYVVRWVGTKSGSANTIPG
jgi:hypothetical protein